LIKCMKICIECRHNYCVSLKKSILLPMKLTVFFLSLCLSQVSGESFGQKITLKGNNVSVKQIIKEFKKQTQYDFIGETKVITGSDKISVDLENANVDDAFRICFTSLGIT